MAVGVRKELLHRMFPPWKPNRLRHAAIPTTRQWWRGDSILRQCPASFAISPDRPDLFHVTVPYQKSSTSRLHHLSKFFLTSLYVVLTCKLKLNDKSQKTSLSQLSTKPGSRHYDSINVRRYAESERMEQIHVGWMNSCRRRWRGGKSQRGDKPLRSRTQTPGTPNLVRTSRGGPLLIEVTRHAG
jgi:hypothetical protein